jgi:hypothetical protein
MAALITALLWWWVRGGFSTLFHLHYYYYYANGFQVLNLRTLRERRHWLDAIFVINVLLGSKSCPSTMDVIGLQVPTQNLRDFPLLVHPIATVPPAGVLLQQIQFVINWMSSEGKFSHLVRCDTILLHHYKVS